VTRIARGRRSKKNVLELGGSDPLSCLRRLMCERRGIGRVGRVVTTAILHRRETIPRRRVVARAFTDGLVAGMRALVVGDPMHDATHLGRSRRAQIRDELHAQVDAISSSAHAALAAPAAWSDSSTSTVLTDVRPTRQRTG